VIRHRRLEELPAAVAQRHQIRFALIELDTGAYFTRD